MFLFLSCIVVLFAIPFDCLISSNHLPHLKMTFLRVETFHSQYDAVKSRFPRNFYWRIRFSKCQTSIYSVNYCRSSGCILSRSDFQGLAFNVVCSHFSREQTTAGRLSFWQSWIFSTRVIVFCHSETPGCLLNLYIASLLCFELDIFAGTLVWPSLYCSNAHISSVSLHQLLLIFLLDDFFPIHLACSERKPALFFTFVFVTVRPDF